MDPNSKEYRALAPFTRFWHAISLVMVLVALGFALADTTLPASQKWLAGFLTAAWLGWYAGVVMQRIPYRFSYTIRGISFSLGMALAIGLSWIHLAYLMLCFAFYGLSFGALPLRWAIPLVSTLSLALAWRFIGLSGGFGQGSLAIVFSFMLSGLFAIVLGLYITRIIQQTQEKQKMIEELEAARGELAQAERQAGMLAERQRMAGEIHDTLAQDFTSVVLHLEAAEQALDHDPGAVRQHLDQARQVARQGLGEARAFLWALRPDVVRHEPLDQAIRRVAQRWSAETQITAVVEASGLARPLPALIEAALLRTAQEALTNVRKHSKANKVTLTLTYMDDEVILDVQDDGVGFDLQAATAVWPDHGYGLVSLREQAAQLGGNVQVESSPGEGTTVAISLPTNGSEQDTTSTALEKSEK